MATIKEKVVQQLKDLEANVFKDGEIGRGVDDSLIEYSRKNPLEANTTLATQADSRLVDISSLSSTLMWGYDDLSFADKEGVEYPTGSDPRDYRKHKIYPGGYIEMLDGDVPSAAGEDVEVRYYTLRTEADIPPAHLALVADIATSKTLQRKPIAFMNEFYAITDRFTNMEDSLDDIDTILTNVSNILDTGEALIGDERSNAITDIDSVTARITQMVADIATARTFMNKANVAQPERTYLNSAGSEGNAIVQILNQAKGYLSVDSTAVTYQRQAATLLNSVVGKVNQIRGYSNKINTWIASVNLAKYYEQMGLNMEAQWRRDLAGIGLRRGMVE